MAALLNVPRTIVTANGNSEFVLKRNGADYGDVSGFPENTWIEFNGIRYNNITLLPTTWVGQIRVVALGDVSNLSLTCYFINDADRKMICSRAFVDVHANLRLHAGSIAVLTSASN